MSIFRLDLKSCPPIAKASGQDGMKNLRTLRHPHVLACLDSVQLETECVVATGTSVDGCVRAWVGGWRVAASGRGSTMRKYDLTSGRKLGCPANHWSLCVSLAALSSRLSACLG